MANNILITRNKGIQKQEILLLEFCKNTQKQKGGQREQTMSTMSTQQSTCFCCWDDLSYGLNTLGPLCLWQCFFLFLTLFVTQVNHQSGKEKKGSVLGRFLGRKKVNTWVDACLGPTLQLHFCPFPRKLSNWVWYADNRRLLRMSCDFKFYHPNLLESTVV